METLLKIYLCIVNWYEADSEADRLIWMGKFSQFSLALRQYNDIYIIEWMNSI